MKDLFDLELDINRAEYELSLMKNRIERLRQQEKNKTAHEIMLLKERLSKLEEEIK